MSDSDSDDELMNRLASGAFQRVHMHHEDCAYCKTPNATLPCTTCNAAYYCSESCKRRHFASHRAFCITTRMQNEPSEDDSDSSESESDEEVEQDHGAVRRGSSARRSSGRGAAAFTSTAPAAPANAVQIPGLTAKQIKRLLELSSKAEAVNSSTKVEELQKQIAELMKHREAEQSEKVKNGHQAKALERAGSALTDIKTNDIKELQKKLMELERKTQTMEISTRSSMAGAPPRSSTTFRATKAQMYLPLLVKDDDAFKKYFKLKDMSMPIEQIRAKMEADGVNPALLDAPNEISPNDSGAPEGAYIPMMVKDDPKFKTYLKLKQLNMPIDQIKMKMEADGVDPELLDNPGKVSPNDPGPPLYVDHDPSDGRMSMPGFSGAFSPTNDGRMSLPAMPMPPYVPLLVKDDDKFKKFFKLQQMGMPAEQIKLKMSAEDLDPTLLDRPGDVSPNDPGPPVSPSSGNGTGPISMEQLFSILMQHQHVIQQVSSGTASLGGGGLSASGRGSFGSSTGPPPTVEDQMAKELAAAESALDDIFGDEQQQPSKGLGGMSMIEQLEKKARKESNKRLVENHDEIVRLIRLVLNEKFADDEQAIKFFTDVGPKLEYFGLALGTDAVQTWSARLLIKNKDTRDWYFDEQERLDAGKAYGRLWSMSFLERDAGQLIAKRAQIINAPVTLHATVKNKVELIDKFTQLLKDTVKLKHKVFKNPGYVPELRRLSENQIPERFDERGTELIDASTVLADAALDLADEEFRILDTTTRAKKIRAHTVILVAEKAIQLVGIVKKLGAQGVNNERLVATEAKTQALRDEYLTGVQEDEDEDDVL